MNIHTIYKKEDYIQDIQHLDGSYKYRVLSQDKIAPTHHTNSLEDAENWFFKRRTSWITNDALNKEHTGK